MEMDGPCACDREEIAVNPTLGRGRYGLLQDLAQADTRRGILERVRLEAETTRLFSVLAGAATTSLVVVRHGQRYQG